MGFTADYFDGRASTARPARVEWDAPARALVLEAGAETLRIPFAEVRVGDRVGRARRVVYLKGAGELHSDDQETVDALARDLRQGAFMARVFRLESHYSLALAALLLSAAVAWAGVRYGVPVAARGAAKLVPPGVEASLGRQGLDALDQFVFEPSELPAARQEHVWTRLQNVCAKVGDCPAWRLEFRKGGRIGANALALPGGILVMTDELVKLSRHDDELVAVAAHELGHVRDHHSLRQVLAGAGVVVLSQVLLGDVGGVGDLSSGLPALLLQSGYSRDMEKEADANARALLLRACLPLHRFADILARLDAAHGGDIKAVTLFSSHPETRERIKAFQDSHHVDSFRFRRAGRSAGPDHELPAPGRSVRPVLLPHHPSPDETGEGPEEDAGGDPERRRGHHLRRPAGQGGEDHRPVRHPGHRRRHRKHFPARHHSDRAAQGHDQRPVRSEG